MANVLAAQLRALTLEKIVFVSKEAETFVENTTITALELEDAADAADFLADGDVDQIEILQSLVDLADLVYTVNLTPANEEKLNKIVDGLLKTGTTEQKDAAKAVFTATLKYLLNAKATNEYFDANLPSGGN